ncbi:MAG: hypothetical protein MK101_04595 [Phycisphaerales bacterium]|nr:hypothetical protein [Phycisphaerales bacterium]
MTTIVDRLRDLRRRFSVGEVTDSEVNHALDEFSLHLNRALVWVRDDRLIDATTLNDECGNLAAGLLELREDADFCKAFQRVSSLPDRASIEPLVLAPVHAARDQSLVDAWIAANVQGAPLADRLRALTALRRAQPRERLWPSLLSDLVDSAVDDLQTQADSVIASGNHADLVRLQQQLLDMGLANSGRGTRLLHALETELIGARKEQAQSQARSVAMDMHLAWAAMDIDAAQQARSRWASLLDADDVDASIRAMAEPVERWLASQAQVAAQTQVQTALIDDLERRLDEQRDVADLEQQYATLQRQGVPVPPRVVRRLSIRLDEHRAARRRRWAVAMGVVSGLAAIVIVAILVAGEARRREFAAALVEQTITRQLEDGDPAGASITLQQAIEDDSIDANLGATLSSRIDVAQARWDERLERARSLHTEALSLLEQSDSEALFLQIEAALQEAEDQMPSEDAIDLSAAQASLRSRRLAFAQALREALRPRLVALDEVIAKPAPPDGDKAGWAQREQEVALAITALEAINSEPIAAQTDIQEQLERRRITLTRLHKTAQTRIHALSSLESLLASLAKTPSSETHWADTWGRLMVNHAGQLQRLGAPMPDWQDGNRSAQAATAVQHWREHVHPELMLEGLLSGGPAQGTSSVAADRLRGHLERPDGADSPYRAIASQLIDALSSAGRGLDVADQLQATGFEDVIRVPLSTGGVLYRRSGLNPEDPIAAAITSTEDLTLPAMELLPASLPEGVDIAGSSTLTPSSVHLSAAIEQLHDGADPGETLLALLDTLEREENPDVVFAPIVRHAVLQSLGTLIPPGETSAPLHRWLADVGRAPSPVLANWPRDSLTGTRQTRTQYKRELGRTLSRAPTVSSLKAMLEAPTAELATKAAPAAPAAIMFHENGRWVVRGSLGQRPAILLIEPGKGGAFHQLFISPDGTPIPPDHTPKVPMLIYERAAAVNQGSP